MICWKCRKEIDIEKVFRTSECPACHADLHSCKACDFYEPGAHNDCREPCADLVSDKERANFCDYFSACKKLAGSGAGIGQSAADKAKNAAAALFGEPAADKTNTVVANETAKALFGESTDDTSKASSAKDAFNALFGGGICL